MHKQIDGSLPPMVRVLFGVVLVSAGLALASATQTSWIKLPAGAIIAVTNRQDTPYITRLRKKDGMVMVAVPAGKFIMGSPLLDPLADADEKPQRTVYLESFWIDRTEVTNAQYSLCVANGQCRASQFKDDDAHNHPGQPVVGIPWPDAVNYCSWIGGRLPIEAEWEKAARGLAGQKFPWGDAEPSCRYAVISINGSAGCGRGSHAWPVGSKPAGVSPYGALDMIGNVWEWTATDYDAFSKVLKGGSWLYEGRNVRAAYRYFNPPDVTIQAIGFRCAMSISSSVN